MRFVPLPAMVLMVSFVAIAHADGLPAGLSNKPLSPKQTLLDWDDHLNSTNADDVLRVYVYSGDDQTTLARVVAEQVVAITKLQQAVNAKWGKDAEAAVLHACGSSTRADDEQVQELVKGDHAVLNYKGNSFAPLAMVHVNGVWKLDIAACAAALGDHLKAAEESVRQITAIANSATAGIADGKYPDADHLAKDISMQMEKVQ